MALSNAERQRLWRQRRKQRTQEQRQKKRKRLEVWVSAVTLKRIDKLQDRYQNVDRLVEAAIRELDST